MKADGRLARATRIELGFSLTAMAKAIGCDKSQLSRLEKDVAGMSEAKLKRLSLKLSIPMERLVPELAEMKASES